MEETQGCFQCGGKVEERIYAIYWGKDDPEKGIAKDDVAGYLCDSCRGKNKMKVLTGKKEWHKLEQLKNLLKS